MDIRLIGLGAAAAVCGGAWGQQWHAVLLDMGIGTAGASEGVAAGMAAGSCRIFGSDHAMIWRGDRDAWGAPVDINPAGYEQSMIWGTDGRQQVGTVWVGPYLQAGLWEGTAQSFVYLAPPGSVGSIVYAAKDGKQLGYVDFGSGVQAQMWSGTAASRVSLHPAGAVWSIAYDMDGGQQCGYVRFSNKNRACLWNGTAESRVNMHPAGYDESIVEAMDQGWQGGTAFLAGRVAHAGVWRGSAASFVDLNPAGARISQVWDVAGEYQVGYADLDRRRALVWHGTRESVEDLSAYLPANVFSSTALKAWTDGQTLYVSGAFCASNPNVNAPVLWYKRLRCPGDFNRDGFIDFFDYSEFVECFDDGACAFGTAADFNGDGFVDFFDYADFIAEFEGGC